MNNGEQEMNIEKLANVFNMLNQMQISGYQNLRLLTAAMQTLEDIIRESQETAEQINWEVNPSPF